MKESLTLSEIVRVIEAVPVEQRAEETLCSVTDPGARWDGEDTILVLETAEMVSEMSDDGPPFALWLHFRAVDA